MKAILLIRVSSASQELDEQASNLIEEAKNKGYSKNNQILLKDVESAISLRENERKGLNRMKEAIENDKSITAVFVWELSRLSRDPIVGHSIKAFFIENHIQLYCKSPEFTLLEPDRSDISRSGSMFFSMFLEMAEAEMRTKKERFIVQRFEMRKQENTVVVLKNTGITLMTTVTIK